MTLLMLLQCVDGLLAVADGRTTRQEPGKVPFAFSDQARKCATVEGAAVIAMSSGRMNFSDTTVADVFSEALAKAARAAAATERPLSVRASADACFHALVAANEIHPIEGRGAFAMVAGYDDSNEPLAFEFTVPDTTGGPISSGAFDEDRVLIGPTYNVTSEKVRTLMGLVCTDDFLALLDAEDAAGAANAENVDFAGRSLFRDETLGEAEARLDDLIPAFIASGEAPLDAEGVGGFWTVYRVEDGRDVWETRHAWGPMLAPDGAESPEA